MVRALLKLSTHKFSSQIHLPEELAPYKILFGEYRSVRYLTEVFECYRRIMLTCVVAISNPHNAVIRAFVGICISFFFSISSPLE